MTTKNIALVCLHLQKNKLIDKQLAARFAACTKQKICKTLPIAHLRCRFCRQATKNKCASAQLFWCWHIFYCTGKAMVQASCHPQLLRPPYLAIRTPNKKNIAGKVDYIWRKPMAIWCMLVNFIIILSLFSCRSAYFKMYGMKCQYMMMSNW